MNQDYSMRKGYVYILINPAFPSYVKIGKTTKDPEVRAKEISSGIGVPAKYEVAWDALVTDCDQVERIVHQKLAHVRSTKDREFFAIQLKEAIPLLSGIVVPFICNEKPEISENEVEAASEMVYKPCGRAFFVYYVAMALCFLGPRLNPEVGFPVWLGTVLGLIVVAAVVYMKWGQEYRLTPLGVEKAIRWPSPQRQVISWANLGEVKVARGLTQTLLQVGNLILKDKSGGPEMFWFGLANPKEVKEEMERRRP